MSLTDFKDTFFLQLKEDYLSVLINEEKPDDTIVTLRLQLKTEEAENFKDTFSNLTCTNCIVYSSTDNPQK